MRKSTRGFTIVELLIVIVVIGVLSAITVVAYNGIQNRAKAALVSSNLNQILRKIFIYNADYGGSQPTSLSDIGVSDSAGVTYQYTANNSSTPTTYCITATSGTVSYYVNNTTQTLPSAGSCPSVPTNIVVSAENAPGETAVMLFDNNSATKWLAFSATGWVVFSTTSAITPTTYSLTSANDSPERDPRNWTLYGSSDRISWTAIDTRIAQTFAARFTKNTYAITGSSLYQHYKLDITLVNGGSITQLADITIGTAGGNATIAM